MYWLYQLWQYVLLLYCCMLFLSSTIPDCFLSSWRVLLSFLINISSDIAELVTPVVCNSSPEGCLPDQAVRVLKHINIDMVDLESSAANAQSLVICCWHCMKEVSLLLGDVVERAPLIITESNSFGLITTQQVHMSLCQYIILDYSISEVVCDF